MPDFAGKQKSRFYCRPNIAFSTVRLFAIRAHTQVFIIESVLNASPGSSFHEHGASVALSNLQQRQ